MEALPSSVKRKIRLSNSSNSSLEVSPAEKRLRDISYDSFDQADEDKVMAIEKHGSKSDLILSKLEEQDTKLEDVCSAVNSLKSSLLKLKNEVSTITEKQQSLQKNISGVI